MTLSRRVGELEVAKPDREWVHWAIGRIEADFNRSADTHLLPVAIPVLAFAVATDPNVAARPWGAFIAVSILLGVVASWTALVCWNRVTQLLPPSIAGQLLVFETIAGLGYAYAWKGALPPLMVVAGSAALIAGVTLGVRAVSRR